MVPLATQLAAGTADRVRVLVIGAGIAGTALAQLLRRQGLHPVLLERAGPDADRGYMLNLLPLADPVLDRLDVAAAYRGHSLAVPRYLIRGRHGLPLREYSLSRVFGRHGEYRGISRDDLLGVLASGECPITYGATVIGLQQEADRVRATIRDQRHATPVDADFDLVVAADGMHSDTRSLILRAEQVSQFDTGVGGWFGWLDHTADPVRFEELWGAGFFVGTYPVPGKTGVFVGGRRADMAAGPPPFIAGIRERLTTLPAQLDDALHTVADDSGYLWSLEDRRAATWSVGRVVLLGDAAIGFLPTAGIGAAMAIESAGLLAAGLTGRPPDEIPERLRAFERAQRPRSQDAQRNSRQLAKLMFQRRPTVAALRDLSTRLIPARSAMRPIRRLLDQQPDLTHLP